MTDEDRFNGQPSIVLDHRPFFSIIVACYNSSDTLGSLLESIINQSMNDDIEVILSDDCSTEPYNDIVDRYRDILSIRQIKTDYNFAPGNTREKGVSIAEGEWITIIDHDDEFVEGSLLEVKNQILKSGEPYYAISNFIEKNCITGEIMREMVNPSGWNHGKFYNLDNLWKQFGVHFLKDLRSHEDIYISSTMNCIMRFLNRVPLHINIFTYIWNARPTTVSRVPYRAKDGKPHSFIETFFEDYLTSTSEVYFLHYENGNIDYNYALDSILEMIGYSYFYLQSIIFHHPDDYFPENIDLARDLLVRTKECFAVDNKYIYNWMANDDALNYTRIKVSADVGSGPYIPSMTLSQWLDYLHKDISSEKITMKDVMNKGE
jgi:glycosyltransferase involved in cell wall biosynthesis